MKRYLASMIAAILLAVMSAGCAVSHGVLDQAFEVPGGSISTITGARSLGQTFKPTNDTLTAVDLHLAGVGAIVRVSIHVGNPAGMELTSATQTITTNGRVHFDFPAFIPLTPGNTYAIRMQSLSGNPSWT